MGVYFPRMPAPGATLSMTWVDLAFLHWPVPAQMIGALLPEGLELDTFEGSAWVAVTPFEMRGVKVSGMLAVPTATNFPELNVRTYVRRGDRSGVWFFSLDAASWLAVTGARSVVGLPYFHARMSTHRDGDWVVYDSHRTHPGSSPAELAARYRPAGDVFYSKPGSFEHWSTERYSLFAAPSKRRLLRLDIEHAPWPLQPATAQIRTNSMATASGISLPNDEPRVHFARRLDVVAHWPVPA
jgi:uncharacterized protein YqjF (DUF2071 family)